MCGKGKQERSAVPWSCKTEGDHAVVECALTSALVELLLSTPIAAMVSCVTSQVLKIS